MTKSKTTTYSEEQVLKQTLEYHEGDELAADVFFKYALRDKKLNYLEKTPEDMHHRLAGEFARVESKFPNPMSEEEIFGLLDHFKYIVPAGSPSFGIGNPNQKVSLSNCFVIDVVDSYGSICRADERIVQISKRRGGVGLDISAIRPRGAMTRNSALTTDGIGVFMERFSRASEEVAQQGRRGALMLSISVHHPEIMTFINIKRDLDKVNGANISIRVTDEFMECVRKNTKYEQRWPVDAEEPKMKQKIKAREVWNEMIKSVYMSAEPGILFWDNIINNSPADSYAADGFATVSTNPCGELPLCPYDSCRLISMNLSSYVDNPFTPEAVFDKKKFKEHVRKAMRLSDDLVELELQAIDRVIRKVKSDPEDTLTKANEMDLWKNIKQKCKDGRRTGLGITGLADCIAMQNVVYGSDESVGVVDMIYSTLRDESYRASITLAKERGAFPLYDHKKERGNQYLMRLPESIKKEMRQYGRRNIGCLTTPPAGSISLAARTSWGFEPVFKVEYKRKRKLSHNDTSKPDIIDADGTKWKEYIVEHPGYKKFKEITGKTFEESPYFGGTAEEIDHQMRVRMQGVATSYVDHSISSTVNLPKDIPIEVVNDLYLSAWEQGCKGLTVYRADSRDGVVTGMNSTRSCDDCDEAAKTFSDLVASGQRPSSVIMAGSPERPKVLECDIHRSKVGGGDWLFFVGKLNGHPYEVFGGDSEQFTIPHKYREGWIKKNGKVEGVSQYNIVLGSLEDENEMMEFKGITKNFNNYEYGAFTRVISLTIRHGVPIKFICEQITKKGVEGDLFSFQRAMSRVLKKYIAEGEKSEVECPNCHSSDVVYKNGCPECKVCGTSNCS